VTFDDFRALIDRLAREVPPEFRNGIVTIEVSPKTVPHPVRGDAYTLGECIPLEWSGGGADLQSRVVLYHGSFAALARLERGDFDWRREAWDTLSHELRHHLEWRANVAALEAYDAAAEQNFARHDGEPFDPAFYRSGEAVAPGVYKVDDDVFIECDETPQRGEAYQLTWHGRRYRVPPVADLAPPSFLVLAGLDAPPVGEAILVIPWKPSLFDIWRRRRRFEQRTVRAEAVLA